MSEASGKTDGAPPGAARAEATAQLAPITGTTKTFGKYHLLAELGRGGMADVHLAVAMGPAGFSKLQVIKRLRPGMTDIEEMRSMMLDEARLAARLNHKNIVQTNEVGIVDEQYFLAMEYLDGQPYHRILKRAAQLGRTLPLPFAVKILCEILSGLHYAHDAKDYDGHPLGVVHRDVSPQNVFVTYDGQVKVVDFGIAKAARRLVETQTGIIRGKITYMAPEQAFANEVDRRADVFSVGVMLWEAVAGERLWGTLSDPEIVARMMREIPRVTTVRPDAPADLADLCARALSRNPDGRPDSAAEMRGELEVYLALHDIQVNAEALGALVADLFAEEHAELSALVDRELAILRVESDALETSDISASRIRLGEPSGARRSLIPSTAIPRTPGVPGSRIPGSSGVPAPHESGPRAVVARGKSGGWGPRPPPAESSPGPPDSMSGPTVPRAPAFDLDDGGATARELSPPVAILSTAPPVGPASLTSPSAAPDLVTASARRWRNPLVYGGAVFLAAAAAIFVGKVGFSDPAPAPEDSASSPAPAALPPSATATALVAPSAPPSSPPAPASASAARPDDRYIQLRLATNPVQARVLFDGSPMTPGKSPFNLKLPRDGAVHRITVEASGFYPQSRMVVFDRDQKLSVFLSRKGAPRPQDAQNR